ncbi:MAG: hypothetical protein ACTSV1_09175 [Alphaproteobacteria bacterium]
MTTNSEIWRCASLLVEKYGEMARNGAAIKADEFAQRGDSESRFIWLKVTRAVEELLDDGIPKHATRH